MEESTHQEQAEERKQRQGWLFLRIRAKKIRENNNIKPLLLQENMFYIGEEKNGKK